MITIRLFGHPRYETDAAVVQFRVPPRAVAMLGYLIVHHDTPVARHFLAELLWPDDDVEAGRAKLRRHVHLLTQNLPSVAGAEPYLLGSMQSLRWNPAAPAIVDTLAFGDALRAGRLDDANRWYGGEFLESFYDDWIVAERERLRAVQLESLAHAVKTRRSEHDFNGAAACADRMLEIDPWREDAVRAAISLRAQLGDRGGALAQYRAFAERLAAELDVEPAPETRAVYDALRRSEQPRESNDTPQTPAPNAPPTMPFIGRAPEFAKLARAWSTAAYGGGGMALIGGEAGVGKSRLARELALHVEREGGRVLIGITSPGETQPYEAVLDALRGSLALVVSSLTPEQLGVLSRALPEIAARTAIVEPPPRGPEAERERLFAAIFEALAVLARRRPLLVVLEDLQWAPASSVSLVEYLARRIATLPVLIVGTMRDEDTGRSHLLRGMRRRLASEGSLQNVAIGRLTRDDVAAIVEHVAPGAGDTAALTERLYAFSEGVPFFIDAALHAGEHPPASDRPGTVARMERLGDNARTLLGIAAVAGAGFSVDVLAEVAGWSESEILIALDELVEARFVREGPHRRFADYAFTHHLIHASVYERVADATRRRRHALVARAMTSLYDERSDAAAEIARHYDAGGDAKAAARAHRLAAHHARAVFANDEALAHVERALALGADDADLVDLHVMRAWLGHALGRSDSRAQSMATLATLRIPRERLSEVERLRSTSAMLEGRFDAALDAAERSLRAALATGDSRTIVLAHHETALIAIVTDRYAAAETALDAAAALTRDDESLYVRELRARTLLAQRRGAHGPDLAISARHLLDEARRIGDPQAEAEAHVRMAHVDIARLDFASARTHFDSAAAAYQRFGNPRGVDSVQNNAANLALWSGDYGTAEHIYEKCFAFAEENNDEANVFGCALGMTLAAVYTSNFDRARERMNAVAHLDRSHDTMEDANWNLLGGLLATECGDGREAEIAFDRSLAIHRAKAPNALFALTLAFATLQAAGTGDFARAAALDRELEALPDELLSAEEFPHLMYWARACVARERGDTEAARSFRESADRLYAARVAPLATTAAAFAAVPWNARFLKARSDAFATLST